MANPNRTIAGKFHIIADGKRFECLGELTLEDKNEEREANSTSSGRLYTTTKAKPYRASCKFGDFENADPGDLFDAAEGLNVTIVESTRKLRHILTNASVVGTPSRNKATGEVDGMTIVTDKYQKVSYA